MEHTAHESLKCGKAAHPTIGFNSAFGSIQAKKRKEKMGTSAVFSRSLLARFLVVILTSFGGTLDVAAP